MASWCCVFAWLVAPNAAENEESPRLSLGFLRTRYHGLGAHLGISIVLRGHKPFFICRNYEYIPHAVYTIYHMLYNESIR